MAVGPSGCGKSTAIRRVALELQRRRNFSIVPAHSADEIETHFNSEIQQVFVIDDLCGKATIDANKVTKWYDLSNVINNILQKNKVRILASCRIHIFQDRLMQKIELFRKATLCDFLSEDFCLTDTEKMEIASLYLRKEETDKLLNFSKSLSFDFFPLSCYLYSRNKTKNIQNVLDFFRNPKQAVRCELKLLWEAVDQTKYGTLMLLIAFNNCLQASVLEGNQI